MKTLNSIFAIILFSLSSFAIYSDSNNVVWKYETIEVGEIPQGTPKEIIFECKNTGIKQIVITSVKPSCGCTAADYTKEAIAPGKSGYIKATYNAANLGPFSKAITVTSTDSEAPKSLTFKGIVVAK